MTITIAQTRKLFNDASKQLSDTIVAELALTPARIRDEFDDLEPLDEKDVVLCDFPESTLRSRLVVNAALRDIKVRTARMKRGDTNEVLRLMLVMKTVENLSTLTWVEASCLVTEVETFMDLMTKTTGIRITQDEPRKAVFVLAGKNSSHKSFEDFLRQTLGE